MRGSRKTAEAIGFQYRVGSGRAVCTRVDDGTFEFLKRLALANGRSIAAQARLMLRENRNIPTNETRGTQGALK